MLAVCNLWFDDAMNWLWYIWIARHWISIRTVIHNILYSVYTSRFYMDMSMKYPLAIFFGIYNRLGIFLCAHFFYSYWTRISIQSIYFLCHLTLKRWINTIILRVKGTNDKSHCERLITVSNPQINRRFFELWIWIHLHYLFKPSHLFSTQIALKKWQNFGSFTVRRGLSHF